MARAGVFSGGSASRVSELSCALVMSPLASPRAELLPLGRRKLGEFRGDSRFTTWAHKFALLEAAVKVRGRVWQRREVQLDHEGWSAISARMQTPHDDAETRELIGALQRAIGDDLTKHQREVLVAVTLEDVPIDVLAERLATTRGALYKTLHDARRKLRASLSAAGLDAHPDGELSTS